MGDAEVAIRDRESALAFLFGRIDYERRRSMPYRSDRFNLDRMREFSRRLGGPQAGLPVVHVAGTKGKGSTAAMLATALTAAGYRTGLYTSPHLQHLEERFVVDGQQCTSRELVELLAAIQPVVAALDREARAERSAPGLTYFEITTAAALLFFRWRKVDCAVIEVGLGGRLDSTNICEPALAAITSISFDHTHQLGHTLAAIAGEKAGIVKRGVPLVAGVRQPEPLAVIERVAHQQEARLLRLGWEFEYRYVPRTSLAARSELDYRETVEGVTTELAAVELALLGEHQAANGAVALAALHQLRRDGWHIPEPAVRAGLRCGRCPARIEVVAETPTVILDTAHNQASIEALANVLSRELPAARRILLFAASQDKDAQTMLASLVPLCEHVVVTRYVTNPRAFAPATLGKLARAAVTAGKNTSCMVHVCDDPIGAWHQVRRLASPAHLICVTGSFFLAAELRQVITAPPPAVPCP